MIEMGKKYKTRRGNPVRILCVDAGGADNPVIFLEKIASSNLSHLEQLRCVNKDGKVHEHDNCDIDLIEENALIYRPFTFEEGIGLVGQKVKYKNFEGKQSVLLITGVWEEEAETEFFKHLPRSTRFGVGTNGNIVEATKLLKDFVFLDDTSCGVIQIN